LRVGGRIERFPAEDRRCLVMPMPVSVRACPAEDYDVGLEFADDVDDFAQDFFAIPLLQSLFGRFRIAEIDGRCKILLRSINLPGSEEFLRPDYAQERSLLRADDVLASFASRKAQVPGPEPPAKREIGQKIIPFIVRMGRDQENTARVRQTFDCELRIERVWGERLSRRANRKLQKQCRGDCTESALHARFRC
jgi:hypothetical protein